MSHNVFVVAGIITVIFVLIKIAEMKVIDKEDKPMKLLVRDALVVYISVVCGDFMLDQLQPFISTESIASSPEVFVDTPDF